jgi:G3E family GTPase
MDTSNFNEIFKKDVKIEAKKIDFSDSLIIEKIEAVNKKQEEILNRKFIDVDKLNVVVQL